MTFKIKSQTSKIKIKNILLSQVYRAVCIMALFMLVLILIPTSKTPSYAASQADVDNLNTQIAELQTQLDVKKKEANTFADEVAVYDGQINLVQLQINATQAQIDTQNAQITNINGQIADNEAKLAVQRASLAEQLRVIYENSNTSTLELIAESNSLSDFVDQSEYLQTIQSKTISTINSIKNLKQQLADNKKNIEQKKEQIASLQQTQLNQKTDLDKQRYAKQILLNQANTESGQYQNSIQAKEAEKKKVEDVLNAPPPPPPSATPVYTTPTGGNPSQGKTVPQLYQTDSRWEWTHINGTSSLVRDYGCKLTSLTMIFNYYGYMVNPGDVATNSHYFIDDLLYWSGVRAYSGFPIDWPDNNYSKADQWASMGKPFIVSGDIFHIGYDHSVVIVGKTASGQWVMNDPIQGPNKLFPLSPGQITDYVFVN